MRRVIVCMLTHEPSFRHAMRTIRYLSAVDLLLVMLPAGQERAFEAAVIQSGIPIPPYRIVPHVIEPTAQGGIRFGRLRREQQAHLQAAMTTNDVGLCVDDDMKEVKLVYKDRLVRHRAGDRNVYASPITPQQFKTRILTLAAAAEARGCLFFTFRPSSQPGKILDPVELHTTVKWSGVLGCFKDSANCFDPEITQCEDWDAAGRIIITYGQMMVLRDPLTIVNMRIDPTKYVKGGRHYSERNRNIRTIVKRYHVWGHPLFIVTNGDNRMSTSRRTNVMTARVNHRATRRLQRIEKQESVA